jgi:hypothetical protein
MDGGLAIWAGYGLMFLWWWILFDRTILYPPLVFLSRLDLKLGPEIFQRWISLSKPEKRPNQKLGTGSPRFKMHNKK